MKRKGWNIPFPVHEGEVFGEMPLFLNAPGSATGRALRECELVEVERDCLSVLVAHNPNPLESLAEQVQHRLDELRTLDTRGSADAQRALLATMRKLRMNLRR